MKVWQIYQQPELDTVTKASTKQKLAAIHEQASHYCWLPGWGFSAEIFLPLINQLNHQQSCQHHLMQWPKDAINRDTFVQRLCEQAPANAIWVGWSLGGVLASLAAAKADIDIERVVTLATGLSFLNSEIIRSISPELTTEQTPLGMADDDYQAFKQGIQSTDLAIQKKTARRFISLCCQNSADPRQLQRQIKSYQLDDMEQLANTLPWLENYQLMDHSAVSMVHCYGQNDALHIMPHPAASQCPNSGHLFWLAETAQQQVLQQIKARDKQSVARQFSRAAATYDNAATIQQQANRCLIEFAQTHHIKFDRHWLDIGCGTGAAIKQLLDLGAEQITGYDLAPGMVEFSQQRYQSFMNVAVKCADADQLPLAQDSAQGIWSSLMLQWSEHPQTTLKEWFRVLNPGGQFLCATLLPGTHNELKQAWQTIDQQVHVNKFTPADELLMALASAGFTEIQHQEITLVELYPDLPSLLRNLKAIGATNVNPGRRQGLGGRAALKQLASRYPSNSDGQLPLTYNLCLLKASKPQ